MKILVMSDLHLDSGPLDLIKAGRHPGDEADVVILAGDMGRSRLWGHGHMHDCMEHEVSGIRIVCNPRGYLRRGVPANDRFSSVDFHPELTHCQG